MREKLLYLFPITVGIDSVTPFLTLYQQRGVMEALLSGLMILPVWGWVYLITKRGTSPLGIFSNITVLFRMKPWNRIYLFLLWGWTLSYFLYLSYTVEYVAFYNLGLKGINGILAYLVLSGIVTLLLMGEYISIAVIAGGLAQVVLLPLSLSPMDQTIHGTFLTFGFSSILNLLGSSVPAIICSTLIPFSEGKRIHYGSITALGIAEMTIALSAFILSNPLNGVLQGVSNFSLVALEGYALIRLTSTGVLFPNLRKLLPVAFQVSVGISLISPWTYYNLTIASSLFILYVVLAFTFVLTRGLKMILVGMVSALELVLALFSVVTQSSEPQLLSEILVLATGIILSFLKFGKSV